MQNYRLDGSADSVGVDVTSPTDASAILNDQSAQQQQERVNQYDMRLPIRIDLAAVRSLCAG